MDVATKTVLVVEDNELHMKLFHDLLDAHGYRILQTRDGMEALSIAREHHPDLKESPFPWLADIKKELANNLGILDQNSGVALRATFIVDPNNIIRHVSVNDGKVGRNPNEILRVLDALQTDELCPCNWKKGEKTLDAA